MRTPYMNCGSHNPCGGSKSKTQVDHRLGDGAEAGIVARGVTAQELEGLVKADLTLRSDDSFGLCGLPSSIADEGSGADPQDPRTSPWQVVLVEEGLERPHAQGTASVS